MKKYGVLPLSENFYSNNIKKQQRLLNSYVRVCNKKIEEDSLWRGRFFVRQVGGRKIDRFFDGSGTEMYVILRFYDKKKCEYVDCFGSVADFCHHNYILAYMNAVIVNGFGAWDNDDPYKDKTEYTKVSFEEVFKRATPLSGYTYFV